MRRLSLLLLFGGSCFLFPGENSAECVVYDADGDGLEDDSVCTLPNGCYTLDVDSDGSNDFTDCQASACSVTLDPAKAQQNITVSNGGLQAQTALDSSYDTILATQGRNTGKWYFEATLLESHQGMFTGVGVSDDLSGAAYEIGPGFIGIGCGFFDNHLLCIADEQATYNEDVSSDAYHAGDIFGVAFDLDSSLISFSLNGELLRANLPLGNTPGVTEMFPSLSLSESDRFAVNFTGPFLSAPPSGFAPYDSGEACGQCVGIDEDLDGVVDREECDLDAGPECVINSEYGVDFCAVLCGCARIDWDNDGDVDQDSLCNINATQCEQCNVDQNQDSTIDASEACADGYCLNYDFDSDGAEDDTFCRNPSSGCDTLDFNGDGSIEEESCGHNIERCVGIDTDLDGAVDLQDCNIDEDCHTYIPSPEFFDAVSDGSGFTDCRPVPNSDCFIIDLDFGGVFGAEYFYCRNLCGKIGFDLDNDGTIDNSATGSDPNCANFTSDDCYLYDADGDGAEDDHFCQDPTTLCSNIDIDADGVVEETSCDDSSGDCVGIDEDLDGVVDRQECDLDAGLECVIDQESGVSFCAVLCGCAHLDWDNDGEVDLDTICNLNSKQCE